MHYFIIISEAAEVERSVAPIKNSEKLSQNDENEKPTINKFYNTTAHNFITENYRVTESKTLNFFKSSFRQKHSKKSAHYFK